MDKLIKIKLSNVIKSEAKNLLNMENLENRLDDLYILRRVVENYEELESNLKEFFKNKDKALKEMER